MSRPARPLSAVRRLFVVLLAGDVLAIVISLANLLGGADEATLTVYPTGQAALPVAGLDAITVEASILEPRWSAACASSGSGYSSAARPRK